MTQQFAPPQGYPQQQGWGPAPQQGYPQQPPAPAGYPQQGYGAPAPVQGYPQGYGAPQQYGPPQQGYPAAFGQPEQQQAPAGTLADFFGQHSVGAGASLAFEQVGTWYQVEVTRDVSDGDVEAATIPNSGGRIATYNDGSTKYVMKVPVKIVGTNVALDPQKFADGNAQWYCQGQSRTALTAGMSAVGVNPDVPPKGGDQMIITYTGDRSSGPGRNPAKQYAVQYHRPAEVAARIAAEGNGQAAAAPQTGPPSGAIPAQAPAPEQAPQQQAPAGFGAPQQGQPQQLGQTPEFQAYQQAAGPAPQQQAPAGFGAPQGGAPAGFGAPQGQPQQQAPAGFGAPQGQAAPTDWSGFDPEKQALLANLTGGQMGAPQG